ncbi:hypothetical protein C7S20_12695 [Christiangramia fulva]|uniref:DUF4932 domain-containing protein n=1 Tax=Christiangramia fulva TaxID=2126553 RepID=A0A2R3Z6Y1_9FLAO|nr:hypothetical protein C7S20_12695 [Christiangramia fulva]
MTLVISGCNRNQKSKKQISEKANSSIEIKVDDRIELFRLAYNLAIMDSISPDLRPCKDKFYSENYLPYKKYSNHPFVQKIAKGDLWNGDLPVLALALNKNLKPKSNLDKSQLENQFGWYGKNIDSVSRLISNFKETINFRNEYDINFIPLKDSIKTNKITQKLNNFFRVEKQPNLIIYFDPLNNITSRSITFLPENDSIRKYLLANICEKSDSIDLNKSLTPKWNKTNRRITFHENSHLYTEDLFHRYYTDEFDEKLKSDKFKNERTNIDEIIVRGITAKIIALNYGKKIGDFEYDRLWPKSKIVFKELDNYVKNKNMTFEEIYKVIITKLEESYS